MALTVFNDKKRPVVRLIEWFLDPRGALDWACGPVTVLDADEFRRSGVSIIRRHFEEYKSRRAPERGPGPVLATRGEKRALGSQRAIRIQSLGDPNDTLILTPLEVQKLSLNGLVPLPEELERTVALDAPATEFWKAFDEVLAAAKPLE